MTPPAATAIRVAELPFHLVEEFNHRVVNEYAEAISTLSLAARSARGKRFNVRVEPRRRATSGAR